MGAEKGTIAAMADGRITESRNSWRGGSAEKRKFIDRILCELHLQPHFCYSWSNSPRLLRARSSFLPRPGPRGKRRRARSATCSKPAATAPRGHCGHSSGLHRALPRQNWHRHPGTGTAGCFKRHGLPSLKDIYYVLGSVGKPLSCRASHRQ